MEGKKEFKTIGMIAKPDAKDALETSQTVVRLLQRYGKKIILEKEIFPADFHPEYPRLPKNLMADESDLVIVIGGDGSFLNAARSVVLKGIPVVGVNRGGLGFLTDIRPNEIESKLGAILNGLYHTEERFLLEAKVLRGTQYIAQSTALNDCVLYSGDLARMIEFEVYLEEQFVCSLRADGMIVSTPTGSTAYSLSGGGPIIEPTLEVMVMVPMHPHTLSSRPIVVDNSKVVRLKISNDDLFPSLSCDGQTHFRCAPNDVIEIRRFTHTLLLIHPQDYDYYHILRSKLQWGNKLTGG